MPDLTSTDAGESLMATTVAAAGTVAGDPARIFRDHIHALAVCRQIKVYESTTVRATACVDLAVVPPVVNELAYAEALHEIGHLVHICSPLHPRTELAPAEGISMTSDGRPFWGAGCCIACEISAWVWAKSVAIIWTDAMQDFRNDCLRKYRTVATPERQAAIDYIIEQE
jgi:hypothetical protein